MEKGADELSPGTTVVQSIGRINRTVNMARPDHAQPGENFEVTY